MSNKKVVKYCIGFYRFTDSKIWNRSQVEPIKNEEKLTEYLKNIAYIDKDSINMHYVELPE
jgi:hypothetical protein